MGLLLAFLLFSVWMDPLAHASASGSDLAASNQEISKQLTLRDLANFEDEDSTIGVQERADISRRIKEETGLEMPRAMPEKQKRHMANLWKQGKAGEFSVQELVDAGVFIFHPVANVHPNAVKNDEDKTLLQRDGREIEVDNIVWGKKMVPASCLFGVMHSTEDGADGASVTIDTWNNDCAAGKRSSSTPFVLGRCVGGRDLYVTCDFETRWSRHCSSKLTARPGVVNWDSIGVEMEHSTEKKIECTPAQTREAACLWTYIQQRAKLPDSRLITHGELQGHLPKDHKSYRTDPEGFDWAMFGRQIKKLRKNSKFDPNKFSADLPPSLVSLERADEAKTKPQAAIETSK